MAFNSHTTQHFGADAMAALAGFWSKVKTGAASALHSVQMGRMISTLSYMTDGQLDQIGITRSEIPTYAERLMAKE